MNALNAQPSRLATAIVVEIRGVQLKAEERRQAGRVSGGDLLACGALKFFG